MPDFDHSGYLQRTGGQFPSSKRTFYFELRGCMLYNWETKPRSSDNLPLSCVNLTDAKFADSAELAPYAWAVQSAKKAYIFIATSELEKATWVEKMRRFNLNNTNYLQVSGPVSEDDEETTVFPSQTPERVSLSDFKTIMVIGKGSFGRVYQVRKNGTNETYAMKAMNKEMVERKNVTKHIFAEKSILQTINHPFIVKMHYAFQTKDALYMILDLLAGGELFFHLNKVVTFDEYRAKFYTAELGLAIGYLHSLNIIYRDLKPENAVLDKEGHIRLTDFGLAKMNVEGASAKTFCGTPEYLAPEFLIGNPHGRAVDWWSLGIMLYEMLYGIPPFYDDNQTLMYDMILDNPLVFPESPHVSDEGKDLLRRLIDRNAESRLQNVEEFKQHSFFHDIDFDKLYRREIEPPFVPDSEVVNNFDNQFTQLPIHVTGMEQGSEYSPMVGFTYDGQSASSPASIAQAVQQPLVGAHPATKQPSQTTSAQLNAGNRWTQSEGKGCAVSEPKPSTIGNTCTKTMNA